MEPHVVVLIQNVQKGKPDGRTQKAVQRVQDCVPVGEGHVVRADLAQDFRRINKQQYDDFQCVGQVKVQLALKVLGSMNKISVRNAEKYVFKIVVKICASMTKTTEVRSRMYTIVTERFSCHAFFEGFELRVVHVFSFLIVQRKIPGSSSGKTWRRGTRIKGHS